MNKKLKTLLSLGVVSILTASTALPVNALSKNNCNNFTTNSCLYIIINGVKYELPLKPICPNKPSNPDVTPETKPDTTPDNSGDDNSNNNSKPNTNPDDSDNNNSGNNTTPDTNPDNSGDNDSNNNSKPDTNPDDSNNNNSGSTTENFSAYQKQVLDLVNAERAKVGLNALVLDSSLSNVATMKSQDMIDKNYFSHTSPTYGSPFDVMKKFGISYKTAGENIAYGQKSPKEVVNAWMNSKGHRENILNSSFTHLGVGVAKNSNGTIYWTQMFIGK